MASSSTHPVRYVDDRIAASRTEVWAWFRLPNHSTALRPTRAKEAEAVRLSAMLRAIIGETQEPVDMHLRTVQRLFDVDGWRQGLDGRTGRRPHPARFAPFLDAMAGHLDDARTMTTETYLGVRLGSRGSAQTSRGLLRDTWSSIAGALSSAAGVDGEPFPDEELAFWHDKADKTMAAAANVHPDIEPISAREAVWLIRKPFYPTYGCPELDIPDDAPLTGESLDMLLSADVEHRPHHVKVSQLNPQTGERETFYTATTCLTEFNRQFSWPEELGWADIVKHAAPNVEWSIRFTVMPAHLVRKAVRKNLGTISEELVDAQKANVAAGRALGEQYAETADLEHQLSRQRPAWLYVTYRAQLRAPSPEKLDALAVKVATELRASNIAAARPAHDQLALLMEAVPAGRWLSGMYQRKQDLEVLGAGGLMGGYEVGDDHVLGPYLGRVVTGNAPPVFFSTNRGIALNRPPATLITGSPGRGKSFLAFTLAFQCAVQGYKVVYLDPKADAVPFANLQGLGNVHLFDLRHGHDGLLDPFRLGENVEASGLLAMEVLRLLVGHLSEERETVLSNAIERQKRSGSPSLWNLSEELSACAQGTPEYNMGALLKNLRSVPFGRLLFSPLANAASLRADDGVTIVTLLGLDAPGLDTAVEDYSYDQRIAVATMYLLTKYAYGLMELGDKSYPKALFVDEAWMLLATRSGKALVERWGRMGRSHNAALVLITQNTADFTDGAILNQVSARFAFGADDRNEHEAILRSLDVPVDESTLQLVASLASKEYVGHCLMRDPLGRVGLIRVDDYDRELFQTFNTNPETRGSR